MSGDVAISGDSHPDTPSEANVNLIPMTFAMDLSTGWLKWSPKNCSHPTSCSVSALGPH
ncbi:hypothetical protein BOTBODRAFT_173922 [Botryobasidium botryosum FD-172 SS1]|uniref:Uncharacterized protein n=1 Tax=Botryobasidium botryosum (strain FD-172 SS1) TaxID=930990 RepID=A0A067MV63_BOTB1|nr:hypothetical protein BOTBODRAFT_173922 [Botryobasidium botryosum FD-172 SS1]